MSRTGVTFRALNPESTTEIGFVFKSWLGSYKNHARDIPYSMYAQVYQHLLERILYRPECVVILAVDPNDPEFIFGFAVIERSSPTLHYMYVKSDMRAKGLGSDFLDFLKLSDQQFVYTFSTKLGRTFLNSRGGKYSPKFTRDELP